MWRTLFDFDIWFFFVLNIRFFLVRCYRPAMAPCVWNDRIQDWKGVRETRPSSNFFLEGAGTRARKANLCVLDVFVCGCTDGFGEWIDALHHNAVLAAPALLFAMRSFQIDRFVSLLSILSRLQQLVLQHFFGYRQEHFFYIYIVFGWCFEQLNVHLFGKTLSIFGNNHLLIGIIVFVSNCKNRDRKELIILTFMEMIYTIFRIFFLLPKTLFTTSQLCSISCNHRLTFAKDSPFVTS